MSRYIGLMQSKNIVKISTDSPNHSKILTGISGSGKSERKMDLERKAVLEGSTVIEIDIDGSRPKDGGENYIFAQEEGLNLCLLEKPKRSDNTKLYYVNYISSLLDVFSRIYFLGDRQKGALREAIQFATKNRKDYSDDLEAIGGGLLESGTALSRGVYEKMWPVLKCGVFRRSSKAIQQGMINVISLENLPPSLQTACAEIFLNVFWKQIRENKYLREPVTIVIDEFQNLSVKKRSTLTDILREGRKYKLDLLLSTQSLAVFSSDTIAALNQAATRLYFRPSLSDVRKTAAEIDSQNQERWTLILKRLKVGEALSVGDFCINGRTVSKPIITKTDYKRENKETYERRRFIE